MDNNMNTLTLIPAYNRDYTNQDDLLADWDNNLDFILYTDKGSKVYFNKIDFVNLYHDHDLLKAARYIEFRYDKLRKVKVIKVTEETLTLK